MAEIAQLAREIDDLRLAGQMYKELAQYVAPKRRSIEVITEQPTNPIEQMTEEELEDAIRETKAAIREEREFREFLENEIAAGRIVEVEKPDSMEESWSKVPFWPYTCYVESSCIQWEGEGLEMRKSRKKPGKHTTPPNDLGTKEGSDKNNSTSLTTPTRGNAETLKDNHHAYPAGHIGPS